MRSRHCCRQRNCPSSRWSSHLNHAHSCHSLLKGCWLVKRLCVCVWNPWPRDLQLPRRETGALHLQSVDAVLGLSRSSSPAGRVDLCFIHTMRWCSVLSAPADLHPEFCSWCLYDCFLLMVVQQQRALLFLTHNSCRNKICSMFGEPQLCSVSYYTFIFCYFHACSKQPHWLVFVLCCWLTG